MCTECEECHWLHFSKGRAEAHVFEMCVSIVAEASPEGDARPLCVQHQILVQNQNPLWQRRLKIFEHAFREPFHHLVTMMSLDVFQTLALSLYIPVLPNVCTFLSQESLTIKSHLLSYQRSSTNFPNGGTDHNKTTATKAKKKKKRQSEGPGYSRKWQLPLCQGERATNLSPRAPRQHYLKPERKFLKEIVSLYAGGQLGVKGDDCWSLAEGKWSGHSARWYSYW